MTFFEDTPQRMKTRVVGGDFVLLFYINILCIVIPYKYFVAYNLQHTQITYSNFFQLGSQWGTAFITLLYQIYLILYFMNFYGLCHVDILEANNNF